MSAHIRTPMIVLRTTKYGEADLIVHGLTPEHGKITAIARSALKSKKRFGGGVLEPTHHIEAQIKLSADIERMGVLEEARLINGFDGLRLSFERLEMALKVVQAVAKVSHEGDVHLKNLYHLTGHALQSLAGCQNLAQFRLHFVVRFLLQQGVLEQEPWMSAFLTTPMAESNKLPPIPVVKQQLHWIETQLEHYLTRAESKF